MPGYTHLQRAQPVTPAYHFMAYFQMFKRDYSRFEDCLDRMDVSPLGSGALAGTTYHTDRRFVAERLGFADICENAMTASATEILRWNFSAGRFDLYDASEQIL